MWRQNRPNSTTPGPGLETEAPQPGALCTLLSEPAWCESSGHMDTTHCPTGPIMRGPRGPGPLPFPWWCSASRQASSPGWPRVIEEPFWTASFCRPSGRGQNTWPVGTETPVKSHHVNWSRASGLVWELVLTWICCPTSNPSAEGCLIWKNRVQL